MSSPDRENVEEFLKNVFRSKGRGSQTPRIPILPVLGVFILLILVRTSFYTVDPEEVALLRNLRHSSSEFPGKTDRRLMVTLV